MSRRPKSMVTKSDFAPRRIVMAGHTVIDFPPFLTLLTNFPPGPKEQASQNYTPLSSFRKMRYDVMMDV